MGRTHYETLGVSKTATAEEIKQAFTRLARELHPDSKSGDHRSSSSSFSSSSSERFTQVKEAFDAIRYADKRASYDRELAHHTAMGYDEEALRKRAEEFRRNYQRNAAANGTTASPGGSTTGGSGQYHGTQARLMRFTEQLLRPRTLALVPMIAIFSWIISSEAALARDKHNNLQGEASEGSNNGNTTNNNTNSSSIISTSRVKAWYNPETQRYETPAPWSPLYRKHRYTTQLVARKDVWTSVPPPESSAASDIEGSSSSSSSFTTQPDGYEEGDDEAEDNYSTQENDDDRALASSSSSSASAPSSVLPSPSAEVMR